MSTKIANFLGTLLDGVASNAAEASRTATIAFQDDYDNGYRMTSKLRLTAVLDYAAATNLTVQASFSLDKGTTYGRVQSISVAAGTGTLSDYTPTKSSGSADASIDLEYNVEGATHAKIILAAAGGGATDLLTLIGTAIQEV